MQGGDIDCQCMQVGGKNCAGSQTAPEAHDVQGDVETFAPAYAGSLTIVFDRVTFDPNIVGGRAGIRGMRVPVSYTFTVHPSRAALD